MLVASDIADWWDEQHKQSKQALDELVDNYPNWFGVSVATTAATAMELGAGLVDVLRLGDGVASGTAGGFARDGLRLLQFAPAVGKVGRNVLARVLANPRGGICTWVSATKALRQVGTKAFASVDDLARAAGLRSISQLQGAFVHDIIPVLRRLGARVSQLPNPRNLAQVNNAVKGDGVVLFSVKFSSAGKVVGHTLYAFRNAFGNILYADRTGKVVKALADLERFYPGIGAAEVYGSAALLIGPRILLSQGIAVLSMEVRAQLVVNPETAAQTLEIKKAVAATRPGQVTGKYHTVKPGERLSKLAQQFYGDMHKWPILYEANRRTVGPDPNLIRPGQRLLIPRLPRVNAKRR